MVEMCTSVRAFTYLLTLLIPVLSYLRLFFSLLFPGITVDFVARANFPFSNMTPCWKMRRPWGRGWDTTMRNQYSNFSCVKLLQLPEYQRLPWTVFLGGVDKTRNMEHPGTFRNIPEHPGTSRNMKKLKYFFYEKIIN